MGALEDVTAHVNAACTLADYVVCKVQRVTLSKLLTTSDNNWDWACCNDFLEVLAVVGLNNLAAHLSNDTSCKLEEATSALHILTNSTNAKGRNAVAEASVNDLAEVINTGKLAISTDEGLNSHAVCVHADSVLDVNSNNLVREVGLQHRRTRRNAKSDALRNLRRNAGPDCATSAHEAVNIRSKLWKQQVKTLETSG